MLPARLCAALALVASIACAQAPGDTQPTPVSTDDHRPRMAGSSTGYIDDAIVGSEIRFRFDADFNLQNPDRAEFFYAKCGCYRTGGDPNAPGPGPGIAKSVNLQELQLHLEYAPNRRISVFVETPVRFIQFTPSSGTLANHAGIGDVRAGFKYAVLAGENRYLTFQFRTYFPSGDSFRGLGTNHYSVEPTLLYYQRFGERLAVSSEFGDWHPIGGSAGIPLTTQTQNGFAGDILIWGLGAGYDVIKKEDYRVTPVVEFVGWSILSGLVTDPVRKSTAGITIANMKIGARLSTGIHNSFYAGYGRELTHSSWYTDIVRFEYRFAF
jgi:hypothetical protein